MYGIYLKEDSVLNFNGGVIRVGQGCCISSNNTTGGSAAININGGELYSDGGYAIYSPAQEDININGGIVQGINARMGKIKISGDAKIIATTINSSTYDDIGNNITTSGCLWLGDTIALIAGTYEDVDGTNTFVEISKDVTVESNFRAAIGIYAVDTTLSQDVEVYLKSLDQVSTTDESFKAIEVYNHEYIADAAEAAGKEYDPNFTSRILVAVNNRPYYNN